MSVKSIYKKYAPTWIRTTVNFIRHYGRHPTRLPFFLNMQYVRFFDAMHGTSFGGRLRQQEIGVQKERANDYSATPRILIRTLKKMHITNNDAIIDLGCGKGLAMYYMSRFPFKCVAGLELSEMLLEGAKENLNKVGFVAKNNGGGYSFIHADAGKFADYDAYNYFYIYNSFPKVVMQELAQYIKESLERTPRKITILYLYPEYPEVLDECSFLHLVSRGKKWQIRYGMHIYQN